MKTNIWLSYDLGITGDYENFFLWLDKKGAKECGDSVAFIRYDYKNNLLKEVSQDVEKNVSIKNRSRIYIIYQDGNRYKGKFLFGKRKRAPWEGYAGVDEDSLDE